MDNPKPAQRYVYVKRARKHTSQDVLQMAIIFSFIVVAALISLWLPAYFAMLPLQGL